MSTMEIPCQAEAQLIDIDIDAVYTYLQIQPCETLVSLQMGKISDVEVSSQ